MDKKSKIGFTKLSNDLYDALLVCGAKLNDREKRVLYLVNRCSAGCQKEWAKLKKVDLLSVGISLPHANSVLERLIGEGLLCESGRGEGYKINKEMLLLLASTQDREIKQLKKAIRRNLAINNFLKGNPEVTKSDDDELPNEESDSY